jgi:lipooligosaccharide transport system ATP-binding protein
MTSALKQSIVQASNLSKNYGSREAVRSISFEVHEGTCFGFLGPNGAGKSSTLKMIYGALPPTSGHIGIAGMNITEFPRQVKNILGVVPQEENLDSELDILENLLVFARYFKIPKRTAKEKAHELLSFFHLEERGGSRVDELSTGLKKRLLIARGLMNQPKILILDEPTTGLDPQSRHIIWQRLRQLKAEGLTILLTTHYMEEASQLCDTVVIIDQGKILETGNPADLVRKEIGKEIIEIRTAPEQDAEILRHLNDARFSHERIGDTLYLYCEDGYQLISRLAGIPHERMIHRPATLEDLFLKRTGRELSE